MNIKKKIDNKVSSFLKSIWSFWLAVALFVFNSVWIAATALYPMAFDEQFHLGLIKLYATKLSPFWSANPSGEAVYGAVARDPSYLYHYLISFPYRLMDVFIPSEFAKIMILRLSSILIFAIGIYIFRKVLLGAGLSKKITHASLLIFVLLPIIPLVAAQINYDNLVFTVAALTLWQTQKFAIQITNHRTIDARRFAIITLLCLFGSLVKYGFVPFGLGVVIYLGILLNKYRKQSSNIGHDINQSVKKTKPKFKIVFLALFIILFGLFLERYAINTVKYSTPTPECDQVLGIEPCLAYGPWRRNYYTKQAKEENRLEKVYSANPVRYLITLWLSQTTYQLFFSVDGPTYDFRVGPPFRVLRNSSVIVLVLGTVLIVAYNRSLRRKYYLKLFGLVSICYAGILLILNYTEFINLGYPFAIQGRYLIPILPLVIGVMVAAYSEAFGNKRSDIKLYLFLAAFIVLLTQGGGAGTYILRSSDTWYWPGKLPIIIDHKAKQILEPINLERNIVPVEVKVRVE